MRYDDIPTNKQKCNQSKQKQTEEKKETGKAGHMESTKIDSRNKSKYIINHNKNKWINLSG